MVGAVSRVEGKGGGEARDTAQGKGKRVGRGLE